MNWDEYFINIAEQVKLKSKDNNTKIGVVLVGKNNEIVSTGYNSFPRGITMMLQKDKISQRNTFGLNTRKEIVFTTQLV